MGILRLLLAVPFVVLAMVLCKLGEGFLDMGHWIGGKRLEGGDDNE